MKFLDSGLAAVPGYSYSAIECNIKYSGRLDYALIVADSPCNASGMFTTNKITAAPVILCQERIDTPIKAILINATNANACTGTEGKQNAELLTRDIADKLKTSQESILMASTGIIGYQLPAEKMLKSHSSLIEKLAPANASLVPRAIMTTDTKPKELAVSFSTSRGDFSIGGTVKGSGMIAPNMATLLGFLVTNAPIAKHELDIIFKRAVNNTLNAITIDGDTSTNDTAIVLSPISDNYLVNKQDLDNFAEALLALLMKLAEMLVADGEGATKMVKIIIKNAASKDDAQLIVKSVAESLLVKTAFFGNDPNWGRIACAAGYSGAHVQEETLSISIAGIPLLVNGSPVDFDSKALFEIMKNAEYSVVVDIGQGTSEAIMLTSDISYDYVKINAEYST